jgi:L-aminopeptidase/D-esterase-like protein
MPRTPLFDSSVNAKRPGNTTLTIFVTNICYTKEQMESLSKRLHDVVESMVYPYGTLLDGDIFFLVSSKEVDSDEDYFNDYEAVIRNAIKSPFIG